MIEKTIRIWIDEEPMDPQIGDLWIESAYRHKKDNKYSIRKKTAQRWQYESEYLTAENLRDLYGVDIEAIERSHLIGG